VWPPQPPLPEEDYPSEDYAEDPLSDLLDDPEDPLAEVPSPCYPQEYSLSHVTRAPIPRAALDRSSPAGWVLNVEPDGTWVFTSEHSQEQVMGGGAIDCMF